MFNCCFYFLLVVHTYTHIHTHIHTHIYSMLTIKLIINIYIYYKNEWRDRLKYPISNWLFQGSGGRRLFLKLATPKLFQEDKGSIVLYRLLVKYK